MSAYYVEQAKCSKHSPLKSHVLDPDTAGRAGLGVDCVDHEQNLTDLIEWWCRLVRGDVRDELGESDRAFLVSRVKIDGSLPPS